jgi:hypothetical protein
MELPINLNSSGNSFHVNGSKYGVQGMVGGSQQSQMISE